MCFARMRLIVVVVCAALMCSVTLADEAPSKVIWSDDMSSLGAWDEYSYANPEEGDYKGGIQVNGSFVQMNSWWSGATYTEIRSNTGQIIRDQMTYTLNVRIESYDNGNPVSMQFYDAFDVDMFIAGLSFSPPTNQYGTFTVSFSTVDGENSWLVGRTLGIAVIPGEMNNLAVDHVWLTMSGPFFVYDTDCPTPDTMTWKKTPYARTATSVSMVATLAEDRFNGVEYFFECETDAKFNSAWQASNLYTCEKLESGQPYQFRVKARDTSINNNETEYSESATVIPQTVELAYPETLPGTAGDLAGEDCNLIVTIDINSPQQTIRGFGASDCWSAEHVGKWPKEKSHAMCDLLFETALDDAHNPRGIGLSIWRMNLGAGSYSLKNLYDTWRQVECFLGGGRSKYTWGRCIGQKQILHMAKARGVEQFVAFAYSPPYSLTKNGLPVCTTSVGETNLDPQKRQDFAEYLTDVLQYFKEQEGVVFSRVVPFNEPDRPWNTKSENSATGWQEGCRYSHAEMKAFVEVLSNQIIASGLNTDIQVCESSEIDVLSHEVLGSLFDPESELYMDAEKVSTSVSAHGYFSDTPETGLVQKRRLLRERLDQYGLGYEQTEYCVSRDMELGRDLGIVPALQMARVIHFDLTIANAESWQWWLGFSPYEDLDGLVYMTKSMKGGHAPSKMLWALGNYSRFIRPGMTRVLTTRSDEVTPEASADGLMVSSYYSEQDAVVVTVVVNMDTNPVCMQLALDNMPEGVQVAETIPYVTSHNQDLAAFAALDLSGSIKIPTKSVVTLVTRLSEIISD